MVAGQDDALTAAYGNPAGSLQGLCRLVDENRTELLAVEQAVGRTYQGAGNDAGLAEELRVNAYLQFVGTVFQALHLLVVLLVATLTVGTQFADGLADGPQQFVVRMTLEAPLVGEAEHLVVDTRWVAYS